MFKASFQADHCFKWQIKHVAEGDGGNVDGEDKPQRFTNSLYLAFAFTLFNGFSFLCCSLQDVQLGRNLCQIAKQEAETSKEFLCAFYL